MVKNQTTHRMFRLMHHPDERKLVRKAFLDFLRSTFVIQMQHLNIERNRTSYR